MELLTMIASQFDIPIIRKNQKVWFFRTKGGKFYHDFTTNNFIALGWDLVSPELVTDFRKSKEVKKDKIGKLYPDEKRPGLIFGQMDTFYNRMKVDDLVLVPDEGTKTVAVGIVGEFLESVAREISEDETEHEQCSYLHRRSVTWQREVDVWQDIYLFKALRAQQTISDITADAKMVFRNLYPAYISGDTIHLTFQKPTNENLSLANNVELLSNIMLITDATAALYGKESFNHELTMRTAVGSPGFLEIIMPGLPVSAIAIVYLIKAIIGKEKTNDGGKIDGLLAVAAKVNDLINDHANRKKTSAEIKHIEANTRLVDAQAKKTEAETQFVLAQAAKTYQETRRLELENSQIELLPSGKTTEEVRIEGENLAVPDDETTIKQMQAIQVCGCRICSAAKENGLSLGKKKIDKVG